MDLNGNVGSVPSCGRHPGRTPGRCGPAVWVGGGILSSPDWSNYLARARRFRVLSLRISIFFRSFAEDPGGLWFLLVVGLQVFQILPDLRFDLLSLARGFAGGEVAVVGIDGL